MGIFDKIKGKGGKPADLFDEGADAFVSGEWFSCKGTLAEFYEFMRFRFVETGLLSKPDSDKVLRAVYEAVEAVKDDPQRINKTRNRIYQRRKLLKGLNNLHYVLYFYGVLEFLGSLKYYRDATELAHPEESIYADFCRSQIKRHTFGLERLAVQKLFLYCERGTSEIFGDDKELNKSNK